MIEKRGKGSCSGMPLLGFRFSPTVNGLAEERRKARFVGRSFGVRTFSFCCVCERFCGEALEVGLGEQNGEGGIQTGGKTDRPNEEGGGGKKKRRGRHILGCKGLKKRCGGRMAAERRGGRGQCGSFTLGVLLEFGG